MITRETITPRSSGALSPAIENGKDHFVKLLIIGDSSKFFPSNSMFVRNQLPDLGRLCACQNLALINCC